MKQFLHLSLTFVVVIFLLFANPGIALAGEGEGGHVLEAEVGGYSVTLSSQNEWAKGENIILVTITDHMDMPVSNAEVEILIGPKSGGHAEPEADTHAAEPGHGSMPAKQPADSEPSEVSAHDEESEGSIAMMESHSGNYKVKTILESSGAYRIQVFFHVNGESLQADFDVNVEGAAPRTIVLWSFVVVNVGLVIFAGILKRQSVSVKGKQ